MRGHSIRLTLRIDSSSLPGRAEAAKHLFYINKALDKTAQEPSPVRSAALNTQIIKVAERGVLRFALPHYDLIFQEFAFEESESTEDEWDF